MSIQKMVINLMATGLTEQGVAEILSVKTTQATIHRIKSGQIIDPKHSLGKAIEIAHADRCKSL